MSRPGIAIVHRVLRNGPQFLDLLPELPSCRISKDCMGALLL